MREYIYFTGWIAILTIGALFFDISGTWIIVATVLGIAWLALKIITDHQEKKLYEELDEMAADEYEQFLDNAEKEELVTRSPANKDE
ncbi:MAG: hypothetical protein AAFY56_07345 [Pseudomonadota bacterium]